MYSNTEARSNVYFLDSTQMAIPRKPLGSTFLLLLFRIVPMLLRSHSSLKTYYLYVNVDFVSIKFKGHISAQSFSPTRYFIISDLRTILCTLSKGTHNVSTPIHSYILNIRGSQHLISNIINAHICCHPLYIMYIAGKVVDNCVGMGRNTKTTPHSNKFHLSYMKPLCN